MHCCKCVTCPPFVSWAAAAAAAAAFRFSSSFSADGCAQIKAEEWGREGGRVEQDGGDALYIAILKLVGKWGHPDRPGKRGREKLDFRLEILSSEFLETHPRLREWRRLPQDLPSLYKISSR